MRFTVLVCAILTLMLTLTGCSTAPQTESGRTVLRSESDAALAKAQANDPTLTDPIRKALAYAVFPTVGKGAIGIGGAYGKGVLYERGVITGYCDLAQGSIGFQLGGQSYTEIILFSTPDAVSLFKSGNFAFDAQATAVALKSGSGANAKYSSGVAVFTMDEAGLMYEASIGGQKFSFLPK
ncbi:MAG: hypothetical protein K2X32_09400 [Phycisphaerales bacterium]|nr:hypothetical protein [Phycisphaerales bacterium]